MTEVFAAVIGVVLGIFLDNIILWKIKQKVEHLDKLLRNVLELNSEFKEFIRLNCLDTEPTADDYEEFGQISRQFFNDANIIMYCLYGPSKGYDINEKVYHDLKEYYNSVTKLINDRDIGVLVGNFYRTESQEPTLVALNLQDKLEKCLNTVLIYRNNLTSLNLKFWLHEIINNKRRLLNK